MRNKKLEANVSMAVSKIFGGFNMNALKFLLPLWMSPLTGAAIRCTFAAAAFWIIGWFMPKEQSTPKEKILLLLVFYFSSLFPVASVGGVGVVRLYVPLSYRVE